VAIESAADRLVFFKTDEFGVEVAVGANTFNGLFDNDYDDELDLEGASAQLSCRTEDVTTFSIVKGTSLVIAGSTYLVRELRADGTGVTLLYLEAQ